MIREGVIRVAPVTGDDVLVAAEMCERLLEPHLGADWGVPVPDLDFTISSVVAHAACACLWYSIDLWSGRADAAFEVRVQPDAEHERLLTSLTAAARGLAAGVDAAPPDTRGYHPFGSPDPAGFAAMACDELLVHGDDAARGLRTAFSPDPELAAGVLSRLYPWHAGEPGEDPWRLLLWANGRIDLPGRPHQERWRWHGAPLAEWDGTAPDATLPDATAP